MVCCRALVFNGTTKKFRFEEANFRKSCLVERDAINSVAQGQKNRVEKRRSESRPGRDGRVAILRQRTRDEREE
jgi:hypothetical protein